MSLNEISIIRELGRGMNGTIYLVADKHKCKYAMKVQQILPNDAPNSFSSNMWREIDFAKTMSRKYPMFFCKLYDYKFTDKCTHIQSWKGFGFTLADLPKSQQTYYTKLFASKHCCIKLWSIVDTTLDKLILTWNKFHYDIFYDLMIQIIYMVCIISKEGYFHRDLHPGNIGLVKTKKKYVQILNKKIPTHGFIVNPIDYELCLHKKYQLKKWESRLLKEDNDIYNIVSKGIWDFKNLKQKYKGIPISEHRPCNIAKEDALIIDANIPTGISKENKEFLRQILYKLLFYEQWQRNILKNKFKESVPPTLYMPINTIIFMIKHIQFPQKILLYLLANHP